MSALIQPLYSFPIHLIEQEIQHHPAWFSQVSGVAAEKMLKNKKTAYLFLLREGEYAGDYYVTFTLPDGSVKHQPFTITITDEGWFYENGAIGGPYAEASIDHVLHQIMHCEEGECVPFVNFEQQ